METSGTPMAASPFCRRASRSRAAGANTDGIEICLLSRMGGVTMFYTWAAEEGAMEPTESRKAHWENVYTKKGETEVSWFQEKPAPSLEMIGQIGAARGSAIIDIGGGASRLVDNLLDQGCQGVKVLDPSAAALEDRRARRG